MKEIDNGKLDKFLRQVALHEVREAIRSQGHDPGDIRHQIYGDSYVNRYHGIAFNKPVGWIFPGKDALARACQGIHLDESDPELAQAVHDGLGFPLACMSDRAPDAQGIVVQNIDISIHTIQEVGDMWSVAIDAIDSARQLLSDVWLVGDIRKTLVCELPAVAYTMRCVTGSEDMPEPVAYRTRSWVVERDGDIIVIRANDLPESGKEIDMEDFMRSLVIRPGRCGKALV
jgi:hypothetical protein